MAQAAIGTLSPTGTSGTALATLLTNVDAARLSSDSGSAVPSYVAVGGLWVQINSSTNYTMYFHMPTGDIALWTYDTTAGLSFNFSLPSIAPQQLLVTTVEATAGFTNVAVPANCNSALVTLVGAGGPNSLGGRMTFTLTGLVPGTTLACQVGTYQLSGGTQTGTYFGGYFAAGGNYFGNIGTCSGPTGYTLTTPEILLASGQVAGNYATNGVAHITWVVKNV